MPRRNDISKVLIIGSGPIVIGQSAEFDYSGTQACKALKSEGYEVVLVNSNPATIMTDPEMADRTYVEPLTRTYLEEIIRLESRDAGWQPGFALLPTVGGQTALNLAVELADSGILEKYGVELIGAQLSAIKKAEDRLLFKDAMTRIGLDVPRSVAGQQPERRPGLLRQDRLSRLSCVHRSRWAAPAAASPTTAKSCSNCWPAASISLPCTKC